MRFHSPPPFLAVGSAVSLRDSGRAGDLEYLGGAQGFSYKTCHVADRERVCNVRESGMSYLSEFSLSRRFVRQSSTNLQAVQSAQTKFRKI